MTECQHEWEVWGRVNGHSFSYCFRCCRAWKLNERVLVEAARVLRYLPEVASTPAASTPESEST